MASATTRALLALAALLGGIIAGFSLNRALVEMPAWHALGLDDWARFTRQADLGRGLLVYPAEGVAALAVTAAAAIAVSFSRGTTTTATIPAYCALSAAILGFIITRFVLAPDVLSLRQISGDAEYLRQMFQRIEQWWRVKAALHVLAFACNVWAVAVQSG